MASENYHVPVMPVQCIEALDVKPGGVYVDCTLGGGGHSAEILAKLTTGKLIAIDKDREAIEYCGTKFAGQLDKIIFCNADFKNISELLARSGHPKADGILADLGVSSRQLDDRARGFSYIHDAELDMRMDRTQPLTAREVVNEYSEQKLYEIIRDYGEEKFAKNIAKNIVLERGIKPIDTTGELARIVDKSIPYALKRTGGHPAKRTFQAIRIHVNGELEGLREALESMIESLNPGGRLVVLTFHSLEDRIVKNVFKEKSTGCICPKSLPVCVCGHTAEVELIGKIITPEEEEILSNPRAASAKLRAVRKI